MSNSSMGNVAVVFILFFFLFGTLGLIQGCSDVKKPDYIEAIITQRLQFLHKSGKDTSGFLVLETNDEIIYSFEVDSNILTTSIAAQRLLTQVGPKPVIKFPLDEKFLIALLGGSTAGFKAKDAFKSTNKINKVLAAIFGGLSGYSLGYKTGTASAPSLKSRYVLNLLNNPKTWLELENKYRQYLFLKCYTIANFIKVDSIKERHKNYYSTFYNIALKDNETNSEDLVLASRAYNYISILVGAKELQDHDLDDYSPAWLSYWWIGLIIIGVYFGTFVIFWLKDKIPKIYNANANNAQQLNQ